MKHVVQSMPKEMKNSRLRMRELETRLAQLPACAGPEILSLYENLLAKEKKFPQKLAPAMAPSPRKKAPKFRISIALLMLAYFIYLKIFGVPTHQVGLPAA